MGFVRRLLALSGVAFFFASCGDDKGSSILDELMLADYVVNGSDDLKECNDDREGMTAYLKDADSLLICRNGDWVFYDSTDSGNSSSSTKYSADSDESSSSRRGVEDEYISGMSPFANISTVFVRELDGETLEEADHVYRGWSTGGFGGYEVMGVTLASPYAVVEISGNYRLGVTGKSSDIPVSLKALVDLSERSSVNVNLLTHLEFARVRSLVASGESVADAKQQAETEILEAFGLEGSVENFGDLDIASFSEGSAILLAIDVILQGGTSDMQLLLRLNNLANDIERNGKWNDSTAKAEMADWAMQTDLSGWLATVRKNMAAWDVGEIANFEKYVRMFWVNVLGLGECNAKKEGEIAKVTNKLSMYYESRNRFLCSDGDWVMSVKPDFEDWEAEEDGSIRWSETGDCYKYDEALEQWVLATPREQTLGLGGCTEHRNGLVLKSYMDYSYYRCSDIGWQNVSKQDYDTYGHECAPDNEGEVALLGDENYATYYICRSDGWDEALEIEYDTYGLDCASKNVGDVKYGVVTTDKRYYCAANGWVHFDEWSWDVPTETRLKPNINYGTLVDSRDGQEYRTIVVGTQEWMAENLNYKTSSGSLCYGDTSEYCGVAGRLYTWSTAYYSSVCPTGWHLPKQSEFTTLMNALGGYLVAGRKMKATSGWGQEGNGTDDVGFTALPAGHRYGNYYGATYFAYACYGTMFWTADTYNKDASFVLQLSTEDEARFEYENSTYAAEYVRCVRSAE